jgi:hypothetical protein
MRVSCSQLPSQSLTGRISPSIGNFTELQVLHLGQNPLRGPIPTTIGNLRNLYYFSIYDTQVDGTIPNELGSIPALRFLDLSKSFVVGSIPANLMSRNISGNLNSCPYTSNMCISTTRKPANCDSVTFPNCANYRQPTLTPTATPTQSIFDLK